MSSSGLSMWGDIANIVIAVASVATAIVTAIVLCKQRKDNILEKQPRFTFTVQDSKLIVRGEQSKYLQIEGLDVYRCVEVWRLDRKLKKVIPLECSPLGCLIQDETGQYASLGLNVLQHLQLTKRFNSNETGIDDRLWNYREADLLCVKYIDIHMSRREQYFVNRTIVSKKDYKRYFKLASKVSKIPLAVSEIDLKTILEIK